MNIFFARLQHVVAGEPAADDSSVYVDWIMTDHGEPPSEATAATQGETTDHSLLRRFRGGSQEAAKELYSRYVHRLRALAKAQCSAELARRVEVDDLVQSVFGSFFRGASRGYYDVPAGEDLWKLFLVIALNKIRAKGAYHRAAMRDVRLTVQGARFEQALETPRDETDDAFLELVVDEALNRLPPRHRQIIDLRMQSYEVAEIAEISGRSKRTVERVLQQARKVLGELLKEPQ